jgi:hypothetical protein
MLRMFAGLGAVPCGTIVGRLQCDEQGMLFQKAGGNGPAHDEEVFEHNF